MHEDSDTDQVAQALKVIQDAETSRMNTCIAEVHEVLRKHGFTLHILRPEPQIVLKPLTE